MTASLPPRKLRAVLHADYLLPSLSAECILGSARSAWMLWARATGPALETRNGRKPGWPPEVFPR